jgi:hypothetical protein
LRKLGGFNLIFVIGFATLTIRAILDSQFRNSTLLYLLVPFAVSLALGLTRRPPEPGEEEVRVGIRYGRHLRDATAVMLASSAFLFEGFLCVLFFMPIYYLIVSMGFLFSWLADRPGRSGRDRAMAYALPALVLLLSAEGLFESTTVPRYREATSVAVVRGSIADLKANMARPIRFDAPRPWFVSIFPMPTRIEAGSLKAGDVHRLHFVYKRWFFANFHEGDIAIRIDEVGPDRIRTSIIENGAYLSHYMAIEGTRVRFQPLGDGTTRVSLTVRYRRLLDPAWYFGPMQQLAAEQSAAYLIDTIIARGA